MCVVETVVVVVRGRGSVVAVSPSVAVVGMRVWRGVGGVRVDVGCWEEEASAWYGVEAGRCGSSGGCVRPDEWGS